jgi:hypothetical protein
MLRFIEYIEVTMKALIGIFLTLFLVGCSESRKESILDTCIVHSASIYDGVYDSNFDFDRKLFIKSYFVSRCMESQKFKLIDSPFCSSNQFLLSCYVAK